MFGLMLLLLATAQVSSPADRTPHLVVSYDQALAIAEASAGETPMIVFAESHGCAPCAKMWHETMQPLIDAGEFRGCVVTRVHIDDMPDLAERLQVRSTPTLIGFRQRGGEWKKYSFKGMQSAGRVRELLRCVRQ